MNTVSHPLGIVISEVDCCAIRSGFKSWRRHGYLCIYGAFVAVNRDTQVLVRFLGVLPQNWGGTMLNCAVTSTMLKATTYI
ncbi:hypothetical protein TNCV_1831201 [Trichonephila clavipes]|nr:hypothetical protein TNCV_1831201 [Trichonephila clavipes]